MTTLTYRDAYLAKFCNDDREERAFAEVDTFGSFTDAWRERLALVRCYIIACLENQADTDDLFSAKLKNYRTEWDALLPQAQAAGDGETSSGFAVFSIPLERG
jgi:hypothetical protein